MSIEAIKDYVNSIMNPDARYSVSERDGDISIGITWNVNGKNLIVNSCAHLDYINEVGTGYIDMMMDEIRNETGYQMIGLYRNDH